MGATAIPQQGRDKQELLEELARLRDGDADWANARTWSLVYHAGDEHKAFLQQAYGQFFAENGLNPLAFKSLKQLEGDVVRMATTLLNGGPDAVGTMTSGGTESILLACKAARDRARVRRPWVLRPEIVAPETIHVAFDKAAHYFGLRLRRVPTGPDKRADVRAMKRAIGRSTVLVAASAPQYPHGVVDPIGELAPLAAARGIPFHVDACVGGFILPWLERLGQPLRPWDFRVPGVTSMSADVHKYGYAAKGASVVLYRDMSYLKHQFFVSTDWSGGIYASPSLPGTRPGGAIAAAWAALMALGEDGYLELARRALDATRRLAAGIRAMPELKLVAEPDATIVTYTSADPAVDIYAVADLLEARGWNADRQQYPACIHCTVMAAHDQAVGPYLDDLRACVAQVKADPTLAKSGQAPMYGMMAKVPLRGLVKQSVLKVMEGMYGPSGAVPDLSKLGEGEGDGLLLKLVGRYGEPALELLDKLRSPGDLVRGALGRDGGKR